MEKKYDDSIEWISKKMVKSVNERTELFQLKPTKISPDFLHIIPNQQASEIFQFWVN